MRSGNAGELIDFMCPCAKPAERSIVGSLQGRRRAEFYRNWERLTAWAVRLARAMYGQRPDPALISLVDELIERSARFRALWARHDVNQDAAGVMRAKHPQVGPLDLNYQQMVLPTTGHVLVAIWAEPGSASEAGLRRLRGS
jgi:hypothetical protein